MANVPNSLLRDVDAINKLLAYELNRKGGPRPGEVRRMRAHLAALNDEIYEYKRAHSKSRRMEEMAKQAGDIALETTKTALSMAVVTPFVVLAGLVAFQS